MSDLTPEQRDAPLWSALADGLLREQPGSPEWHAVIAYQRRAIEAALLATAEPGEAGHYAGETTAQRDCHNQTHIDLDDARDEIARLIALRAPVADAGLDVGTVAKALHWWAGHTHDEACTCADRAAEFLPFLLAATPTEPPRPYADQLDVVDPSGSTRTIDEIVAGKSQKQMDFDRDDAARAVDNYAEPYPGNTDDADAEVTR